MKGQTNCCGVLPIASVPRCDLRGGLSIEGLQVLVGQTVFIPAGAGARWSATVLAWLWDEDRGPYLKVARHSRPPETPVAMFYRLNQVDLA